MNSENNFFLHVYLFLKYLQGTCQRASTRCLWNYKAWSMRGYYFANWIQIFSINRSTSCWVITEIYKQSIWMFKMRYWEKPTTKKIWIVLNHGNDRYEHTWISPPKHGKFIKTWYASSCMLYKLYGILPLHSTLIWYIL